MAVSKPIPLVLDTSVWINLLATGRAKEIVEAIGMQVYVPEQVLDELRLDPVTRKPFLPGPHPVLESARASIALLSTSEMDIFVDLVGAVAPDRLGDGEAASIAIAVSRNCRLCVDERKANRIVRERFSSIQTLRSTDILTHPALAASFGPATAADCYALAVKYGRMHVV